MRPVVALLLLHAVLAAHDAAPHWDPPPLPADWIRDHEALVRREIQAHRFGFIVGRWVRTDL